MKQKIHIIKHQKKSKRIKIIKPPFNKILKKRKIQIEMAKFLNR